MPFKESSPMEERIALLRDYDSGVFTVTELCARYGISRETFYEWQRRRESGDERWFEDRSHATNSCPHRTPAEIVDAVIAMRKRRLRRPFGPKKIRAQLMRAHSASGGRAYVRRLSATRIRVT